MRKKLVPGENAAELPALRRFDEETHPSLPVASPPSTMVHPESLRLRIEAPPSATHLPAMDGFVAQAPPMLARGSPPPRPPRRPDAFPPALGPRSIRTELPALGALASATAASRPGGPESPRATGTTTLGITTKDAVVLGTDHRASAGGLVSHMDTQKLFMIEPHLGMTIAGLVGDAQELVRVLKAEARFYAMKHERPIPVKAAATRMANLLNARKFSPYEVALIVGGTDRHGPRVFSLDEAGGSIPDKWTTTGSGSRFVYGVLEDRYRDDLTLSDAVDLAIHGLNAATHRDSG
ncbi:MAG: hypothetical protein HYT80_11320, partial [Euryarchaeota archaeon]|nr:hypothetical protein [Euryarchaeota archaeon]